MDKKLKDDLASVLARLRDNKMEYYLVFLDRDDPDGGFRTERYASQMLMDMIAMNIIRQKP